LKCDYTTKSAAGSRSVTRSFLQTESVRSNLFRQRSFHFIALHPSKSCTLRCPLPNAATPKKPHRMPIQTIWQGTIAPKSNSVSALWESSLFSYDLKNRYICIGSFPLVMIRFAQALPLLRSAYGTSAKYSGYPA